MDSPKKTGQRPVNWDGTTLIYYFLPLLIIIMSPLNACITQQAIEEKKWRPETDVKRRPEKKLRTFTKTINYPRILLKHKGIVMTHHVSFQLIL